MLDSVSFKYFLGALISLVVITNPLSKIPLFMSLAAGMTHEQRKQQANLAAIYSFAVMFVSLIGGNHLKPGELVVSSGVHHIKDGETVKPLAGTSGTNIGGLL